MGIFTKNFLVLTLAKLVYTNYTWSITCIYM